MNDDDHSESGEEDHHDSVDEDEEYDYFDDDTNALPDMADDQTRIRKIFVVSPNDRISSNMINVAEMARAIGIRAKQIDSNGTAYTDYEGLNDAISIAKKEFFDRRSPMILCRTMGITKKGEKIIEKWVVREMAFPI